MTMLLQMSPLTITFLTVTLETKDISLSPFSAPILSYPPKMLEVAPSSLMWAPEPIAVQTILAIFLIVRRLPRRAIVVDPPRVHMLDALCFRAALLVGPLLLQGGPRIRRCLW